MKSEKETIYDYAAELKLLAFKENWNALSLAAEETKLSAVLDGIAWKGKRQRREVEEDQG